MNKKRRCIGCNEIFMAEDMIKITKEYKDNEIIVNPKNTQIGRSVYICKNENCLNTALKKDRLSKNLKKNLTDEEKENIKILLNRMIVVQH